MVQTRNQQTIALPQSLLRQVTKAQQDWQSAGNTGRVWNGDAGLWTGRNEADWLDWLGIVDRELRDTAAIEEFGRRLRADNFSDVLLLGMGGSSLGPEVLAKSLGSAPGFPKMRVLDSTDPTQVRRFEHGVDIARTLFIVSSKSGTTLETNVLMDYFFARASAVVGGAAASRFVAITDPGSRLQTLAETKGFRRIFFGVPGIGGRYSVLSHFGMVPLAAAGHDPRGFLQTARVMAQACGPEAPAAENPGVALGLVIGAMALCGRDKLTLVASPSLASFGAWAEQLLAESTGKDGKGIIPIAGEALGPPSVYDAHRMFVYLRDTAHPVPAQDQLIDTLTRAGHPVARIDLPSPEFLAQEFFRFEMATIVAGAVLGINPFDQPDVEASKIATRAMTEAFETTGALPSERPVAEAAGISLYTDERNGQALRTLGADATLESWLRAHFARLNGGDYFALLAYIDPEEARLKTLQDLRAAVRDHKRVATCLQFGPRFLHSTGQVYKGGPNSGVFLQVTAQPRSDLAIPGRKASFGVIEAAQARGDFRVLADRGRRVLHADIAGDVDAGLATISKAMRAALT